MAGPKIVFFGNERLATGTSTNVPILRALIAADYHIAAVVLAQGAQSKSRKARPAEILDIAQSHDIPVLSPTNLADAKDELTQLDAQAAVLVAYGKLIPPEIIGIFPSGIINIHPSLLPKHRGSIPIESVIRDGDFETGVSLMKLVQEMDAGPVYDQQLLPLTGSETKQQLADTLAEMGKKMLLEHLPHILSGDMKPSDQNKLDTTYDERITKDMANLDFSKPAATVLREIRAYYGWPRSRAQVGDTAVIITEAHVIDGSGAPGAIVIQDKLLGISTHEGILIIDKLIPAGKKEMTAQAFMAGYTPH